MKFLGGFRGGSFMELDVLYMSYGLFSSSIVILVWLKARFALCGIVIFSCYGYRHKLEGACAQARADDVPPNPSRFHPEIAPFILR